VRHVVEHPFHVAGAGADAAEKILPLFVELVGVIAEEQFAESVDGEDRGLEVVGEDAEEADQLLVRNRTLRIRRFRQGFDDTPPISPLGASGEPGPLRADPRYLLVR
jgi:hypothetical protein